MEWQPIETAPRDGTLIDLCVKIDGELWCWPNAEYDEGRWWAPYVDGDGNTPLDEDGWEVTHWRPRPSDRIGFGAHWRIPEPSK